MNHTYLSKLHNSSGHSLPIPYSLPKSRKNSTTQVVTLFQLNFHLSWRCLTLIKVEILHQQCSHWNVLQGQTFLQTLSSNLYNDLVSSVVRFGNKITRWIKFVKITKLKWPQSSNFFLIGQNGIKTSWLKLSHSKFYFTWRYQTFL